MKLTLLSTLMSTAILLPSFAAQAGCESQYKSKLEQISNNRSARNIGNYTSIAVMGLGGAAAYTAVVIASLGGASATSVLPIIAGGSLMIGGETAWGTYKFLKVLDREDRLQTSYNSLKFIDVSEEELIRHHRDSELAKKIAKRNKERAIDGLPPLNQSEIAIISANMPLNQRSYVSLDSIIRFTNQNLEQKLSFDEIRLRVKDLNNNEKLCQLKRNGSPHLLSPRQIGKLIASEVEKAL
jgi:hypothetical protein